MIKNILSRSFCQWAASNLIKITRFYNLPGYKNPKSFLYKNYRSSLTRSSGVNTGWLQAKS